MPLTLVHPKLNAALQDTSSLDGYPMTKTIKLNDLYVFLHPSSDLLLHLLLGQNLVLSLPISKLEKSSLSLLKKQDTLNHPHQFTVIIPWPLE